MINEVVKAFCRALKFVLSVYFRLGVHFLLVAAGVCAIVIPPMTVEQLTDQALRTAWGLCFIVGGLSCMWGLWRFSFRPQIVGSVFNAAAMALYAVALTQNFPTGAVAFLVFVSYAQSQLSRAQQLKINDDAGVPGSGGFWRSPVAQGGSSRHPSFRDGSGGLSESSLAQGTAGQAPDPASARRSIAAARDRGPTLRSAAREAARGAAVGPEAGESQ